MTRTVKIEPHQIHEGHLWEVSYPGILERCVKCKVYKYMWTAYVNGLKTIDIGEPQHWNLKELEGGE